MASSSPSLGTETSILSPAVLAQSPHLPTVTKLLNYTYDQSHINARNGGLLPPNPTTRLQSLTQLSSELEPHGFTILMFSSEVSQGEDVEGVVTDGEGGVTLIATGSAKPYIPTKSEGDVGDKAHLLFKRPPPNRNEPEADTERRREGEDDIWPKWEILAMAVHPTLQGRGLASTLLGQVIEEIKIRAASSIPSSTSTNQNRVNSSGGLATGNPREKVVGKGKVMLMLSTMLELNESYYLKRGFISTAVRRFEPGTMGSRDGFSVVEMMRWVDL